MSMPPERKIIMTDAQKYKLHKEAILLLLRVAGGLRHEGTHFVCVMRKHS